MSFHTFGLLIVLKLSCAQTCLCFLLESLQIIVGALVISLLSDFSCEKNI